LRRTAPFCLSVAGRARRRQGAQTS
jgi:hypothetical protein